MIEPRGGGVLITGGTGFLGRAIARHYINSDYSSRLCIYSRGEHAQARMFEDLGRDEHLRMFIGDVRDKERLLWAMRSVDTVIHAAALKRIEVGHYNPGEMVKTNVMGAMNVVEAAIAAGVRRVVFVSTDKAFQPVSAYGISKAMAEAIMLASNNTVARGGPSFAVCRYGNVAGSTGSVIPIWRDRMAIDAPITISDPDVTRFWMTVDQAVALVMSATHGDKELLIPELPAFRLGDLAEAMGIREGSYPIVTTTLGQWEKKHEALQEGVTSDKAPRMTVEELRVALAALP